MPSMRKNILTMNRIHFIAPDGYLRLVMASWQYGTAMSWMRTEFAMWICYGLLTPNANLLTSDALSSMSLWSTIWNSLVYTDN